jgi:UrcA family protein
MNYLKSASSLALAATACLLASPGANAQSMEVVTVEAVREIVVGKSAIGAPIKEMTIRSRVSYADLDLTTESGANELTKRIKDTASSTCKEIKVDVPVEGWTVERCIKEAVDGAMVQAKTAVDAAKAAKK